MLKTRYQSLPCMMGMMGSRRKQGPVGFTAQALLEDFAATRFQLEITAVLCGTAQTGTVLGM